jgi:type I restriction enzyme S subunit
MSTDEIEKYGVHKDDVLFIRVNGSPEFIGKCIVVETLDQPVAFSDHLILARLNEQLDPRYLQRYCNSPQARAYMTGHATTSAGQLTINQSVIKELPLPLPPLSEQRRIAAILSDRMADIERARAAVEAELAAAEALTAAYLREVFESEEAQKWPLVPLGEVLARSRAMVHPHDNPSGAVTFVGLEHIESGTGIRLGAEPIDMATLTGRKPIFYKGQVVYGYLRPYLNKVWVAEFDGLCSVDQYVYSVAPSLADTEFIAWFMRSPLYIERSPLGSNTGQLPRIRADEVASVAVNLPSLDDQKRIAAQLNEYLCEIYGLRTSLKEQLNTLMQLPADLLCSAFGGGI